MIKLLMLFCFVFLNTQDEDTEKKNEKPVDIKKFVPTRDVKKVAPDLRASGPFDDDFPIPQNPKVSEKLRSDRVAWNKKRLVSSFEAIAKKSEAWFEAAKKGLDMIAVYKSASFASDSRSYDPAYDLSLEAKKLDCTDPLLILAAFPFHGLNGEISRSFTDEYGAVLDNFLKGNYPASLKAEYAWDGAVKYENATTNTTLKKHDYYPEFWKNYVELCKSTDPLDQQLAFKLAQKVHRRYVVLNYKRSDGHKAIQEAFEMAKAPAYLKNLYEGDYRIELALDAKAKEKVKDDPEAKKLFNERLALARKSLTAAYEANKAMPDAAILMIDVCNLEKASREEMESWFTKAMTADPDSYLACQMKLNYFRPNNNGKAQTMLTFARQCLRTGNDDAFLGHLLFDAHLEIEKLKRIEEDDDNKGTYFSKSENWADVREVFESRLKKIPECRYSRSRWGLHCLKSNEGPGAYHNLNAVRDKPWHTLFPSGVKETLKEARKLAELQERNDN